MTHPLRASVLRAAAGLVVVLGALTAPIAAGAQADPGVAPATSTSADGRTTTDGQRTLTTSQAAGLDPAGQTVAVAGSGYDPNKGIYVALCAIPPRNALPSPCGGGVDREGQAGAAQWISSNPPDYGVGLAQPYGPSGTFSTRFTVRAEIAPGIDCRQVRCALVTRSDHTRTSDRSQDIFIPVSFRADPVAPPTTAAPGPGGSSQAPGTTAPGGGQPTVDVPTTAAPEAPKTTAPEATVSGDGTEVTDGVRTLRVSDATDLDPEQVAITVAGTGFDAGAGIYVALCATAADPRPLRARARPVAVPRSGSPRTRPRPVPTWRSPSMQAAPSSARSISGRPSTARPTAERWPAPSPCASTTSAATTAPATSPCR